MSACSPACTLTAANICFYPAVFWHTGGPSRVGPCCLLLRASCVPQQTRLHHASLHVLSGSSIHSGSATQACKAAAAEPVLACMPGVLLCLTATSAPVRSSALSTLASELPALGTALLPALPSLLPALISAGAAATQRLPSQAATSSGTAAPPLHLSGSSRGAAGADDEAGGSGDEGLGLGLPAADARPPLPDAVPDQQGPQAPAQSARSAAGEAAAALAALEALVGSPLGAYITPQLEQLQSTLLQGRVVGSSVEGVRRAGARIQQRLPEVVPARLLLPALTAQLGQAMEVRLWHAAAQHGSTVAQPSQAAHRLHVAL